jgi:hypothetical protein
MQRRFFDLFDDMSVPRRWLLGEILNEQGRELDDPWQFTAGRAVRSEERLKAPIEVPGRALDFSLAGLSVPVVHARVASVFAKLATDDVQLIPVDVEGHPEHYRILVVTKLIRCIDEKDSEVQFWRPEDGLPEKVGEYFSVDGMRIDKSKVGAAKVFRTEGWDIALIVSEDIKNALDRIGATGTEFTEV